MQSIGEYAIFLLNMPKNTLRVALKTSGTKEWLSFSKKYYNISGFKWF